jgi:uncharacterized membrane protein
MAAKARAGSGAAKRGSAPAKTSATAPAKPAAKSPAKTPAKVAAPARAKSGADAARPVNGPGARKGGTQVRTKPAPVSARPGSARPVRGDALEAGVPAEAEVSGPPTWLRWTTFVLALAGLGVSVYLTYAHYTESALAGCTETTGVVNCGKVTTSAQSMVFGIPVAVLGLAFYVFLAGIMSPWAWMARRREVGMLRLASMVVGIGFVLYLLYAELFDIGSICLYCTSVHVITFVLFVLTGLAVAVWGFSPQVQQRPPLR